MLPEVAEDHVLSFLPLPPALALAQASRAWRAACSRARFDALEGISPAAQARWSTGEAHGRWSPMEPRKYFRRGSSLAFSKSFREAQASPFDTTIPEKAPSRP